MAPENGGHHLLRAASWAAGGAHQEAEIVDIELPADLVVGLAQRCFEALEGPSPAFDVGIVLEAEHDQIRAALFDDPPDILGRVRREADLAVHVVRRPHRQRLQALLVLVEGLECRLHLAQP